MGGAGICNPRVLGRRGGIVKILNIIQCANLGGMEQSAMESLAELSTAGHEVMMLSLHPVGDLRTIASTHGISLKGSARYCLAGLNNIPWLLCEIYAFQPDRILLTGHNYGSLVAAMLSRCPTFLSIHYHHGDRPGRLWKSYYSLAKRGCSGIRFISRYIYGEVADLFVGYGNTVCFPNIFRTPGDSLDWREARAQLDLPETAFLIGNAGWLIRRKAFDVFLEVAALVVKQVPDAVFVVAGDGEERQRLEYQAKALGIADAVRFLGWQKDLAPFYRALDILLFNSRFDALGRTPVEALSYGIPVVASVTNGGLDEFIRHGQDGFLIDRHDEEALANEVVRLHGDPRMRESVAVSGRERVLEMGSPEQHLKHLTRFLEIV